MGSGMILNSFEDSFEDTGIFPRRSRGNISVDLNKTIHFLGESRGNVYPDSALNVFTFLTNFFIGYIGRFFMGLLYDYCFTRLFLLLLLYNTTAQNCVTCRM